MSYELKVLNFIKNEGTIVLKVIIKNFILLFGLWIFISGLFSFNHYYYSEYSGVGQTSRRSQTIDQTGVSVATYYYYDYESLDNLKEGTVLIAIGLLKNKNKKRD